MQSIREALADVWWSYCEIGHRYYDRILPHVQVRELLDGRLEAHFAKHFPHFRSTERDRA